MCWRCHCSPRPPSRSEVEALHDEAARELGSVIVPGPCAPNGVAKTPGICEWCGELLGVRVGPQLDAMDVAAAGCRRVSHDAQALSLERLALARASIASSHVSLSVHPRLRCRLRVLPHRAELECCAPGGGLHRLEVHGQVSTLKRWHAGVLHCQWGVGGGEVSPAGLRDTWRLVVSNTPALSTRACFENERQGGCSTHASLQPGPLAGIATGNRRRPVADSA